MNVKHSLLRVFELGHNVMEATKNICCAKGEAAVDHSTVTRWVKKFRLYTNYHDNQARSTRPKSEDSEAVLQAKEVNPVSNILGVSGELSIAQSSVDRHLYDLGKSSRIGPPRVTKTLQNF